jgi:hypothetical protein
MAAILVTFVVGVSITGPPFVQGENLTGRGNYTRE